MVRRARLAVLPLCLAACAAGPSPSRDPAPWLGPDDLACVVCVSGPERGIGSAIVIGSHRLLTARHVVDGIRAGHDEPFTLVIGFRPVHGRVVAEGDAADAHGDWAVVQVDTMDWPPEQSAPLHAPALAPGWRPAPGTEVVLAGYATRFFPPSGVDPREPAPTVVTRVLAAREGDDAAAAPWSCECYGDDLAGMSGGAVFVRNAATGRAEVIGVLVARSVTETELVGPLGIRIGLGSEHVSHFVRVPAAAIAQ
ncbi:MAG TPA: trypsin-like peptidase domain-containing protein [Planctomycetota bacterium]|nr:trypsin-like peptidase domain-containing protein [Planctomycetota bacterium]